MSGAGEFTSKLAAYCTGDDSVRALANAFEQSNLAVNLLQVQHVLQLLKQCAYSDRLSDWGQICLVAAEMIASSPLREEKKVVLDKDPTFNCEVFLGGSCNPTTWRRDIAIPTLEKACVTYYNPQRDDWSPELVAIEEKAKQSADVLLFVLDNQTRAVASMIEVAYLAGVGRDVVSVVLDVDNSISISGDKLSPREVEDLNRGRAFVKSILEVSNTSTVERDLPSAISTIVELRSTKEMVSSYNTRVGRNIGSLANKISVIVKAFGKGELPLEKAKEILKQLDVPTDLLSQYLSNDVTQDQVLLRKQNSICMDDFCSLYCELRFCTQHNQPFRGTSCQSPPAPAVHSKLYDIFLGGSCGHTSWRHDIAIPILKQQNVSYYNPQIPDWNLDCIPIEMEAKSSSKVILVVVTGQTLSVASMVEASAYIGSGQKVVLSLEDIPITGTPLVEGIQLSERAVKDYNRARTYLRAIAKSAGTPLFTDIAQATRCACDLARNYTPFATT